MKIALLGADDESLALVWWAVDEGGHDLVAAFDVGRRAGDVRAIAPGVRPGESWEALLLGSVADAVIVGRGTAGIEAQTGISDAERRADQLRKLVQAAVPLIVVCPACESIVGFEIDMIRRHPQPGPRRPVIVPLIPGADHPAIRELEEIISAGGQSLLGTIEQITLHREQTDRSRQAVLVQLARDVAILRRLIGPIRTVTASGPPADVGRDPLGPRPRQPPPLANLSVHFTGAEGLPARWSIAPAFGPDQARLTVIGADGRVTLSMPRAGEWSLEAAIGTQPTTHRFAAQRIAPQVFSELARAIATGSYDDSAFLAACRDQEVAEAVDHSLLRGRTIELFGEQHTEQAAFKGVMAMGGCLLLAAAFATLVLVAVVEGLRLPIRNWLLWRLWPILVLVPIAVFLLLQFLQLVVTRQPAGDVSGTGKPADSPSRPSNLPTS